MPDHAQGGIIAAVLTLSAIGFLAVITASVAASLIENSRRRFAERWPAHARLLRRRGSHRQCRDPLAERRRDHGHDKRAALRGIALFLSLAIPVAFIAYIDHVRKTVGFNWLGALGALVAISIVIAVGVVANRRNV